MTFRLLACLLFLSTHALAEQNIIASFTDPAGDDVGAGNLVYPLSPDYQEGDLDLRLFTLTRESAGFWFEATFANPIRNPSSTYLGAAAESLSDFARKGFYAFNIDIYIDTDRRGDSGNTFSLPGRHVRIDPGYAWDKAVILTPRPELMRAELLDALQRQNPEQGKAALVASIDQSIFLPTKIRVHGKSIAFFVPQRFFGDSDASDWAMTVMVTGAKPYTSAAGGLFPTNKTPLEELDLGVLQPAMGRPRATFGYNSLGQVLPVVDLLVPTRERQVALLSSQSPLTGMSWGPHAVNDAALAERHEGAARAYVNPSPSPAAEGSLLSNSWSGLKSLFGKDAGRREAASTTSAKPIPVQSLLDPGQPGAATSMTAPASAKPGVAERLRTLKQLYDDKLIDEVEYNKYKQRVLDDL